MTAPSAYTEDAAVTCKALEALFVQVSIVLTLIGPDRPGLVELLAQTVNAHDGNWLESRMSRLAGKFAGILHVEVPENQSEALQRALTALASNDLQVVVETSAGDDATRKERKLSLELVGTDRPGIVREVSQALAERGVNVDELHTGCSTAPMSNERLFRATAKLHVPPSLSIPDLCSHLEKISADLMVDIEFEDESAGK
jgi:glycine cleavage system regulatory protein